MPRSPRYRNWIFTINNPDHEPIVQPLLESPPYLHFEESRVKYGIWQLECGSSGTRHLQGYLELKDKCTLGQLRDCLSTRAHLEPRRGSQSDAIAYCSKGDTRVDGPWSFGSPGRQGNRTDLHSLCETIVGEGLSIRDVRELDPSKYVQYRRGLGDLCSYNLRERAREFRRLEVLIYYGDAGAGKTRLAVEQSGTDYYILDQGERVWFDGYEGESILIIDDFYGWIKWGFFLRLLDGYQLRLEIKGGFTYALWNKVIITSNKHPFHWYDRGMDPALQRRITKVYHFTNNSEPIEEEIE